MATNRKKKCTVGSVPLCTHFSNEREKFLLMIVKCTAEPTLLCTLLDFADDAEADTRQVHNGTDPIVHFIGFCG